MTNFLAKPILKWVGGKSQLLPELCAAKPASFRAYFEPFLGGGAHFFYLISKQMLNGDIFLADINSNLFDVYTAVQSDVEAVIALLKTYPHDEDFYYSLRAKTTDRLSLSERAARIIYLNKTCYNGLYRENKSGQFNVPFGSYVNPTICDVETLRVAASILQRVNLKNCDFEVLTALMQPEDFVYFDPPYHPASVTASFTTYTRYDFTENDQKRLASVFANLHQRGSYVLLSNSDTAFIRNLYQGYHVRVVQANRAINSKGNLRGKVNELLISNYPLPDHPQNRLFDFI